MKRPTSLVIVGIAAASVGAVGGHLAATTQEQATNYLLIEEFEIPADRTLADGIEQLSEWVRILRATDKHSAVRLFLHDWGPALALYIVSETTDWNAVGTIFDDILAVQPDLMNEPLGFSAHSDNILREIPVQ